MMGIFDDIDSITGDDKFVPAKAPFGYPGSKRRHINNILPHFPTHRTYVEPFCGTASILLAKPPVKFEVINDKYTGITDFYKCLQNKNLLNDLIDRLSLTVHSKEHWYLCYETWENVDDPVERAARWYFMTCYSFSQLGRTFGRSTTSKAVISGKLINSLKSFTTIHDRLKHVQIENCSWEDCIDDYDDHGTVFYFDPPYLDAQLGAYKHNFNYNDHKRLLDTIFTLKGFCAISSYKNELYDSYPWTTVYSWDARICVEPMAFKEGNRKQNISHLVTRDTAKEVLYIREAH